MWEALLRARSNNLSYFQLAYVKGVVMMSGGRDGVILDTTHSQTSRALISTLNSGLSPNTPGIPLDITGREFNLIPMYTWAPLRWSSLFYQ